MSHSSAVAKEKWELKLFLVWCYNFPCSLQSSTVVDGKTNTNPLITDNRASLLGGGLYVKGEKSNIVINDGKINLDGTPYEVFSEVDTLHSIGLESPQSTELVMALREEGIDITGDVLTEDECIEALYNFLS